MALSVQVDKRKFDRLARFFPGKLGFQLRDAFDHIGRKFLSTFRKQRLQGPPGVRGASGFGLFGTFKRIMLSGPNVIDMGLMVRSNSPVAVQHEKGGVVRSPGGNRMAIPLSARTEMFTSRGKLRARYKKPQKLKGTFQQRIGSNVFIFQRDRKGDQIIPRYVLKQQVTLQPRLEFFKTWDSLNAFRVKRINTSVSKAWESL